MDNNVAYIDYLLKAVVWEAFWTHDMCGFSLLSIRGVLAANLLQNENKKIHVKMQEFVWHCWF